MDKNKMRREFEEWYAADAMPLEGDWFRRDPSNTIDYADETTDANWRGWKAAYRSSYRLGYLAGHKAARCGSEPTIDATSPASQESAIPPGMYQDTEGKVPSRIGDPVGLYVQPDPFARRESAGDFIDKAAADIPADVMLAARAEQAEEELRCADKVIATLTAELAEAREQRDAEIKKWSPLYETEKALRKDFKEQRDSLREEVERLREEERRLNWLIDHAELRHQGRGVNHWELTRVVFSHAGEVDHGSKRADIRASIDAALSASGREEEK